MEQTPGFRKSATDKIAQAGYDERHIASREQKAADIEQWNEQKAARQAARAAMWEEYDRTHPKREAVRGERSVDTRASNKEIAEPRTKMTRAEVEELMIQDREILDISSGWDRVINKKQYEDPEEYARVNNIEIEG